MTNCRGIRSNLLIYISIILPARNTPSNSLNSSSSLHPSARPSDLGVRVDGQLGISLDFGDEEVQPKGMTAISDEQCGKCTEALKGVLLIKIYSC